MTHGTMKRPVRLLEAPGLSGTERSLLEAGMRPPVAYDVDAGIARFHASLAGLAAASLVTGAAKSASGAGAGAVAGTTAVAGKLTLKLLLALAVPVVGTGIAVGTVALGGLGTDGADGADGAGDRSRVSRATTTEMRTAPAVPPAAELEREPAGAAARERPASEAKAAPILDLQPGAANPAGAAAPPPGAAPFAGAASSTRRSVVAPLARDTSVPAARVHLEETPEETSERAKAPSPRPKADVPRPVEAPEPVMRSAAALEMQALARARALLAQDPAAAFAALEAMRREHPAGYFVEERRALTVLALSRAGNQDAARERGKAFLKQYPNGPFTDRVRAAVSR